MKSIFYSLKRISLYSILLTALLLQDSFAQQLLDNFNDNTLTGWTTGTTSANPVSIAETNMQLEIDGTGDGGASYISQDVSSLYTTTLNTSTGLQTWTFNIQQSRINPSGLSGTSYGVGVVLAGSNADLSDGTGYAIVLGESGTADDVRLVRFTSGLDGGTLTDIVADGTDYGTDHLSIGVTYNPTGDVWTLYVRDDGASFVAPSTVTSTTASGSASDNTHTGTALNHFGAVWHHSSGTIDDAEFDNFSIPSSSTPNFEFDETTESIIEGHSGTTTATVNVTLTTDADCTIDIVALGASTAGNPTDYTISPTSLTFTSGGTTSQTVTITVNGDSDLESDETVILQLQNTGGAGGCAIGTDDTYTLTITNDEDAICPSDCKEFCVEATNLPVGGTIDFYYDTNENFNPYNEGTLLGSTAAITEATSGTLLSTSSNPACPSILGIMTDACDGTGIESDNEFILMVNGNTNTPVSNIDIDLPNNSNINTTTGYVSTATAATSLSNAGITPAAGCLIPIDGTSTIPANALVLVITSNNLTMNYNFTDLCNSAGTIYVLMKDQSPATGSFSNSGGRTTVLSVTGCSNESYSYVGVAAGDGAFFQFTDPDPTFTAAGNNGGTPAAGSAFLGTLSCSAPPIDTGQQLCFQHTFDETFCNLSANGTFFVKGVVNIVDASCTQADATTSTFALNMTCPELTLSITGNDNPECAIGNVEIQATFDTEGTYDIHFTDGTNTYTEDNLVINSGNVNTPITIETITAVGDYFFSITSAFSDTNDDDAADTGICAVSFSGTSDFTIYPTPSATVSIENPTCIGDAVFTISPSGGPPPYTITYTDHSGNTQTVEGGPGGITVEAVANGTYTLVGITDEDGFCTGILPQTTTINLTAPPTLNSIANQCGDGATPIDLTSLNNSIFAGTATFDWLGIDAGTTAGQEQNFTPQDGQTLRVEVRPAGGCPAYQTVSFSAAACTTCSVVASNNSAICANNDLTLTATISDGTSNYTYQWSNGITTITSTSSTTTATIANVTTAQTGIYTVTITDANNCTATATTAVTINPLPTAAAQSSNVCLNQAVTLVASSNATNYLWSGGSTAPTQTVNTATAGTQNFTVTVTDTNNCTATATAQVVINPLPTAAAQSSNVCLNQAVTLVASSNTTNYLWSGGSTASTQTVNTATAGTQNFTVTVTDANNCTATATAQVVINPLPTAAAQSSTVCLNQTVTISVSSNATNYLWSAGSTAPTQTVNTATAGTQNFTVTVTDANNCTATVTAQVVINPPPTAAAQSSTVCLNQAVTLVASSNATNYLWSGGSTAATQTVNTATAGTQSFTVTVTDASNCTATATAQVVINPLPTAAAQSSNVCLNQTVTISVSSNATNYLWSAGSTASTQTVNTATAGTQNFTVTVTDASNCTTTATTAVTINPLPTAAAQSSTVCLNQAVTLVASSNATNYLWSGGSTASTQTVNTATAGTQNFTVTVTDASNCTTTATTQVVINPLPTAAAQSSTVCLNQTVTISVSSNATNYLWSAGSTAPTQTVNTATAGTQNFTVTVTDANNCTATATAQVVINPPPTAAAQSSTVCLNQAVTLVASSNATNYLWSGGSTAATQTVNTTTAGTQNFTVTVTDASNCTATATAQVVINPLPTAAAQNSTVCLNETVTLSVSSNATNYLWSGGSTASTQTVNTATAGTQNFTVTVTDASNCTTTATTQVVINPLPTAAAQSSTVCLNQAVTLVASSNATNYFWSGGSTAPTQTVNTATAGTQNFTVTVTDASNCTTTATTQVVINPLPTAAAQSSTVCLNQTVTISVSSNATNYLWSAGSTAPTQTVNTATAGTQNFTVTVTDANNCTATATAQVVINPPPTAAAQSSTVCLNQAVTLVASSNATNYLWSGGSTAATQTVNTTTAGTQNFTVTVTDASNCTATATAQVVINPLPTAAAQNSTVCLNETVTLSVSSNATNYLWSGGSTASTQTVNTATAGTQNFTVTVTDASNCTTTATTQVVINPLPTAAAQSSTVCLNQAVTLVASSNATNYFWSGGSTAPTQTVNTATAGTQNFTVTVTDASNCTTTATTQVVINPLPTAAAQSSTVCLNQTVTISVSSNATNYLWSAGSTASTQTVNTATAGTQNFTVTVTDASNCTATATAQVVINPLPTVATQSSTVCLNETVTLSVSSNAANYLWSGGSTAATQTVNTTTAGTQNFTVTVTDASNCTATATAQVVINPPPTAAAQSSTVCLNQAVTLTVNSNATNYLWSAGSTAATQTVNTATAGTQNFTVTVTDTNNCTATATTAVTINPLPTAAAQSSTVCLNQAVTLTVNSNATNYLWSGGSTAATQTVNTTTAGTQNFTVTVTDASNCTATATTQVVINPPPTAAAQSSTVCLNQAVTLTVNSNATNYLWSAGSTAATQTVNTATAGTQNFTVTVTDTNNCTTTTTNAVTINPLPTVATQSSTVCLNETVTLSVSSNAANYLWSAGSTASTQTVNTTTAGTQNFTVTVTDASNCTATATTAVTINPLPTAAAQSSNVCLNETVTLSVSSNAANYLWSAGSTASTQTVNTATASTQSFTVTVTDASNCTTTATTQVVINPLPTAAAQSSTVCLNQTVTISVSSNATNYLWSAGSTASTQTVNTATASTQSFMVTVTDASNCTTTATTAVTINPLPTAAAQSSTVCLNQAVTLVASSNTTNYLWSGGSTASTQTVNTATAGTQNFTVTVTDASNCTTTATTQVVINPLPTAAAQSSTVCLNQTVTISVSSNATNYLWSAGSTASTQTVNTATASTQSFMVTVTDASNCTTTATTAVTINPLPTAAAQSSTVCLNQAVTLVASSNTTNYLWSGGSTASTQTVNTATAGTQNFTVTVTDANNCTATATAQVVINPPPTAAAQNSTVCLNQAVTLSVSSNATNYLWSGGSTAATQTVNTATAGTQNFTVTVTDANNCTATATTAVTINPLPTAAAQSSTVCLNQAVTLVASSNTTNYLWSGGSTASTQTVNTATAGTQNFTVTVTDANNCTATATAQVVINPPPTAAAQNSTVCLNQAVTLSVSSNATNYLWSGGSTAATQTVNTATAGTQNFTVTVTDANNCTATATTAVTINPLPTAAAQSSTVCLNETVTLSVSSNATNYLWSGGSTAATQTVNTTTAGTQNFTVTVTDTNNCTATATTAVTINPLPTAAAQSSNVCLNQAVTLVASSNTTNYLWSGGSTASTQTVNTATAGTQNFTVTVTDTNNCTATATTAVTINPLPTAAAQSSTVCLNETVTLSVSSNATNYLWSAGSTASTQTVNTATASTQSFTVTITDANNCTATATTAVTINPLPTAAAQSSNVCLNETVTLSVSSNAANYLWSAGSTASTQTVNTATAGTQNFTVTVTDASNCTATATAQVVVNPAPIANMQGMGTVCLNEPVTLTVNADRTNYIWSEGSTTANQVVNTSVAGTQVFTVTITNINNCSSTVTAQVVVNPLPTTAIQNVEVCLNETATLAVNSNATGFVWSGGLTIVNQTVDTSIAGIQNFTVTVTDANNCSSTATAQVVVNPLPTAAIQDAEVCFNEALMLTVNSNATNYLWSGGSTTVNQTVDTSIAGTQNFTATVTDANNCSSTTTAQVVVNPLPTAVVQGAEVCLNETATLTVNSNATGFAWSGGSTSINQTINTTIAGIQNFTVTVTDANNCTATATAQVVVNSLPTASIQGIEACLNETVTLTVNSNATGFTWSGGSTSVNQTVNTTVAGIQNFTVTVTYTNNCSSTTMTQVVVNPLPTVVVEEVSVCGTDIGILDGRTGFAGYDWSNGASTQTIEIGEGNYTLEVSDLNGCTATTTASVVADTSPSAVLQTLISVCDNPNEGSSSIDLMDLVLSGNMNGIWTDDSGNVVTSFDGDGMIGGPFVFNYSLPANGACSGISYAVNILLQNCALNCPELDGQQQVLTSSVCSGEVISLLSGGITAGDFDGGMIEWVYSSNPNFDAYSSEAVPFNNILPSNNGCSTVSYYLKARLGNIGGCLSSSLVFAVDVYPNIEAGTTVLVDACQVSVQTCADYIIHYNGQQLSNPAEIPLTISDESPVTFSITHPNAPSNCQETIYSETFECEPAGLGNFVWIDTDNDGQQGTGEMGINGVEVQLLDANGNVIAMTTTSNHPHTGEPGYYLFTSLNPGTYIVAFGTPTGYLPTTQNEGSDESDSDANPTTGQTGTISLSSGEFDPTIDAGFTPNCCNFVNTNKVDLQVCSGDNLNLQVELTGNCPNEINWSNGATGLNVNTGNLTNDTCEPIEVTFTATIESLENCPKQEQTFTVTVLPLPSMNNISVNKEDCQIEVDACAIFDISYSVNGGAVQNGTAYTANSGEIATITFYFNSPDCGTFTLEEELSCTSSCPTLEAAKGMANLSVCSGEAAELAVTGTGIDLNQIQWSNGANGGMIAIGGIVNDTCEPILETFRATLPPTEFCAASSVDFEVWIYPNPATHADVEIGGDGCVVSATACPTTNIIYQLEDGTIVSSDTFSAELGSGLQTVNFIFTSMHGCGNATISATINCFDLGALGNYVWNDLNQNGLQDLGEPGIGGIFVHLYAADGTLLETTRTDEDGFYLFDDLPAGDYYVVFDIPEGYISTTTNAGDDALDSDANPNTGQTAIVSLGQGEINLTIDAGIIGTDVGAIGNLVWIDFNGNGMQDEGELGIAGVIINLLDDEGNIIDSTVTDENGNYSFTNLPPGGYQIEVVNPELEIIDTNQGEDDGLDNNVNPDTGLSDIVTIVGGESDVTIDIGVRPACSDISNIFVSDVGDCIVTDGLLFVTTNEVTLSVGAVVVYVLYTDPHDILGSIIAQNTSPFFTFDAAAYPNTGIAAISGPDLNGDGFPDAETVCFEVAEGPSIQAQILNLEVQVNCASNNNSFQLSIQIFDSSNGSYDVLVNGDAVEDVPSNEPVSLGQFAEDATYTIEILEEGTDCVLAVESGIGDCTKLPVGLLEFNGEVQVEGNYLQWITASELNNDYFDLYYSTNGVDFEQIASIDGSGTSSEAHLYGFLHRSPANGTVYYYLTQTNFDGTSTRISQTISLHRGEKVATDFELIEVLPIPASDFVDVHFSTPTEGKLEVVVYDVVGRKIHSSNYAARLGFNTLELNVQYLPAGVYVLSLDLDGVRRNVRIVVE